MVRSVVDHGLAHDDLLMAGLRWRWARWRCGVGLRYIKGGEGRECDAHFGIGISDPKKREASRDDGTISSDLARGCESRCGTERHMSE